MTDQERSVLLLEALPALNVRLPLQTAQRFHNDWRQAVARLSLRQWHLLVALSSAARGYERFAKGLENYLEKAAAKDKDKQGWGDQGFKGAFLQALSAAATTESGAAADLFRHSAALLPEKLRNEVQDRIRLQRARVFATALLQMVRTQEARR